LNTGLDYERSLDSISYLKYYARLDPYVTIAARQRAFTLRLYHTM